MLLIFSLHRLLTSVHMCAYSFVAFYPMGNDHFCIHARSIANPYGERLASLEYNGSMPNNRKSPKIAENAHEFWVRCACGCGAQVLVQALENGDIMIDTRVDGRHRWVGVVVSNEDGKRLKDLLL